MKKWLLGHQVSVDPVRFFVLLATIFGIAFLLITPPFQGADEIVHYERAYQIAQGQFVSSNTSQGAGGLLPVSVGEVIAESDSSTIKFYPQNKYDEHRTKRALAIPANTAKKKYYNFAASAPYSPVPYIGASTGIAVARLLHLPTLVSFYAGRLGDLIMWLLLVGAAIYFLPRRKWALVAVGLLPTALFQAATLNSDAVTVGSAVLFVAMILHYRERSIIGYKVIAGFLAVATLMVLSKQIMFVFLPLLLLLKRENFNISLSKRANLLKLAIALFPLLLFGVWMWVIRNINSVNAYANHQNPAHQLSFIVHSPYSYINVLWNTYFYTWGDSIIRSFIGTFGWGDTPLSELVVTIGYIGLALLFIANGDRKTKEWFTRQQRWLLAIIAILYWAAVNTALYLYYSPVGFKIVYGLQGRYFLPLALLALLLLPTSRVRIDKMIYRRIEIYLPLFLLVSSVITIYVRYFIHNV